jgi:hypothetical protein
MLELTASQIANTLGLDETIIQNLLIKAGVKEVRPSDESYHRKDVFKLVEYFIDKSAMKEARMLADFEKRVEFQQIPEHPDPLYLKPTYEQFIMFYVPDPWGRYKFMQFVTHSISDTDETKEFDKECMDVMNRIRQELRDRKIIEN